MAYVLGGLSVTVDREELLGILQKNREEHKEIVVEARKVFADKAEAALRARLDDIRSGKVSHLNFSLQAPVDHTSVYDTAIKMVQMHKLQTLELNSDQVESLVEDKWNWTRTFYATNSAYSGKAASKLPTIDE